MDFQTLHLQYKERINLKLSAIEQTDWMLFYMSMLGARTRMSHTDVSSLTWVQAKTITDPLAVSILKMVAHFKHRNNLTFPFVFSKRMNVVARSQYCQWVKPHGETYKDLSMRDVNVSGFNIEFDLDIMVNGSKHLEVQAQELIKAHKQRESNKSAAKKYGISIEAVTEMRHSAECEICGESTVGHIDHDHKTGKVRGLLCVNCNQGLGHFGDDTKLMTKAIKYLKKAG